MRQGDGERHQLGGFAASVAEHHALVAGPLVHFGLAANAHVDILALLVDGAEHAATFSLELVLALSVANLADHVAYSLLHVDIAVACHLAADHGQAGGDQRFASHMAFGVVTQKFVQKRIADLVGHFVGMAFGNRF